LNFARPRERFLLVSRVGGSRLVPFDDSKPEL
jgi:hypothetical protein